VKEYEIFLVPANQCRVVWKDVRDLLKPAVERSCGRWNLEYILAALVLNEQQLWVVALKGVPVGTFTTEINFYPQKKVLAIHFLGGSDFVEWFPPALTKVEKFAQENGCVGIECNARFGFWKWFEPENFRKISTFYEKDIYVPDQ